MNVPRIFKLSQRRFVLNWDGTREMLQSSAAELGTLYRPNTLIYVVQAMPHESIYSYGANFEKGSRAAMLITQLKHQFEQQSAGIEILSKASLTLLFGDRIHEITRFSAQARAELILTAPFIQSNFSKWVHGDLNKRLVRKAQCAVKFVLPSTNKPELSTISRTRPPRPST